MDEEDTHEVSIATSDTDRALLAVLVHADTDEWDDTDRDVIAQGTLDECTPAMFEDTGVMIVDSPPPPPSSDPMPSDRFAVTFHKPTSPSAKPLRATTEEAWPPAPREPAVKVPLMRERAIKRARVYSTVQRPDTGQAIPRIDFTKKN